MAKIADLTIKVSAQIAELQKSFDDAFGTVAKFEKQYAGVASSIEARQQELKKSFQSFAGDNITREASVIAEAINKVGGASKLTAAEQKRANATLTEAIEKYKALGETAPKALLDMAKATAQIPPPPVPPPGLFDGILKSAAGVATGMLTAQAATKALGAAFDIVQGAVSATFGTLQEAVTHTANLGDELFALSQKTGLSVESLSAFKFVAAQTNTSLDSITGAVFKLEANLGSGAKNTAEALKGIGLSLKDLRGQDPADAFASIIGKLNELPNASARAATGVAIFGKSFKDIAQLSQEDLPALIKQAKELGVVMSTETAVAADRFNDALGVISGAAEGLKLKIGAQLLPALIAFAEGFGTAFQAAAANSGVSAEQFGKAIETAVVQSAQAASRLIAVFAALADAVVAWASQSVTSAAAVIQAQIDLSSTAIKLGRVLDQVATGGSLSGLFDQMQASVKSAQATLDGLVKPILTAGVGLRQLAQITAEAATTAGDNFAGTYQRIQAEIAASADKMRKSLKAIGNGGAEGAGDADDAFKSFGKNLAELTAQIDRAVKNGTPIAELIRLFGEEAAKATPKAKAWGIAVKQSVLDVAAAFNSDAFEKAFDKIRLPNLEAGAGEALKAGDQFGAQWVKGAQAQFIELPKTFEKLNDGVIKMGADLAKKQFGKLSDVIHEDTPRIVSELTNPFRDAFQKLGEDLPKIILSAIQGGGNVFAAAAVGAATIFATSFRSQFNEAMKAVEGDFSKLSFKNKSLGLAATGLESFTSGFALGQGLGKGKGALAGAAAGAAIGANPALAGSTLGLSIGIGAGVGALAGFFGGRSADKKIAQQLEENKAALIQQFGGMTKLTELAAKLGVNIQAAFDAKKPKQFQDAVDSLNAAIDGQNKRLEGINTALEGVNTRASGFGKTFLDPLKELQTALGANNLLTSTIRLNAPGAGQGPGLFGNTDKLSSADRDQLNRLDAEWDELSKRSKQLRADAQPQFERLGLFVRDTFAAIVKETGNAFKALTDLAPSFETLKTGINDVGLTSTAVIDSLVASFDLVNDAAFKPFFENIQASGQLLKGLFDANALSPDTFQAVAADIGQSIQEIVNRGGDMAKSLALSAPQLQTLWEAQQRYGVVTDQTTQSILNQAVQQGIVGEQFRSVNEKILDVLLAIGDALGAVIPAGLRGLAQPAQEAADAIKGSLGGAVTDVGNSLSGDLTSKAAAAGKQIYTAVGGSLDALVGRSKSAADGISDNLAKIRAPEITIPVDFDYQPSTDPRVRFENEFRGVPALATGGIVTKRTLAIVGEAGPEAVIPLNRLSAPTARADGPPVVFEAGSIVLQGIDGASIKSMVDGGAFISALDEQIRKNTGGLGTSVRRAAKVTA